MHPLSASSVAVCMEEAVCVEEEDGSTGVALALAINSRAAVNKITCIFDTLSPYADL